MTYNITINPAATKTITVGDQTNIITAGTGGSATFPVTTTGIANGSYSMTIGGNMPANALMEPPTIANNAFTLTLNVPSTVAAGTYSISITIDGTTSNTFNLVVNPAATTPNLSVSPASLDFSDAAESKSFTVTSNVANWSAASNAAWATVTPASGSNNGTVTVHVAANTSTSPRTATITVSGTGVASKTVTVTQDGYDPTPTVTFDLSISSLEFDWIAASLSFEISSNVAWTITKSASAPWLSFTPESGANNGVVTVTVANNTTGEQRTATITVSASGISPRTVTVTQSNTIVGNETVVKTSLKAYVDNGMLYVSGVAQGSTLRVYSITGALIACPNPFSGERIALPARGIYIVTDGKGTVKVMN